MLKIESVTKKFGMFTAVNNVTIEVQKGEIFGVIGANGAGKTTTFRMILGLLDPSSGIITWNKEKISPKNSEKIGYLPEERGLYPKLTVYNQIMYFAKLRGMKKKEIEQRMDEWLEKFQISDYKFKKAGELSKGNQQKIQFIYSVIHEPELLILDEPFSGLDPVNVELLKKAVSEMKEKGTTILFSTHRMEHVEEMCESVALFKKGEIVEKGRIKDIKRKYGTNFLRIETDDNLSVLQNHRGVLFFEKTNYGCRLEIENREIAQKLLKEALKHGSLDKFEIEEPTLNEIFIKKIGDINE